jgi:hypothetical protein
VARVAGKLTYTPREWRDIIERCLKAASGRTLLVMLEGAPPDVGALRAALLIGDLLAQQP